jgi:NhaP-type Na+/H+ or K+/H+ antiporter
MTWSQALAYAATPLGVGVIAGLLLSWLADYVPRFTYLDAKQKRLVFLAACLLVPIVASLAAAATGLARLTWDPLLWNAIVAGVTAFGAGTVLNTRSLPSKAESDAYAIWHARFVSGE